MLREVKAFFEFQTAIKWQNWNSKPCLTNSKDCFLNHYSLASYYLFTGSIESKWLYQSSCSPITKSTLANGSREVFVKGERPAHWISRRAKGQWWSLCIPKGHPVPLLHRFSRDPIPAAFAYSFARVLQTVVRGPELCPGPLLVWNATSLYASVGRLNSTGKLLLHFTFLKLCVGVSHWQTPSHMSWSMTK